MESEIKEVAPPADEDIFEGEGEGYAPPEPKKEAKPEEPVPEEMRESPVTRALKAEAPCERAFIANQYMKHPESLVFTGKKTYVLDMTKPEDVETHDRLQTENADPDFGLTIDLEDIKFSEKTDSWKIFLLVSEHTFLPISHV